uniref:Aromatic amino acid beta-eliminating lyase/threonine aldolase domain-containing protein n=1 Tax=Strombidium rassoulzadegani TaxID=1082188 RepID=A0A7S3FWH9_9SPIT
MVKCAVGDDVYEDDPNVEVMQDALAEFFGKEAALYLPSGTQSNLCSIMTNCRVKGSSAILGDKSHIYNYERGGMAAIGSIFPQVISNQQDGTFSLEALKKMMPPPTEHIAQPSVICLENSHGGCNGATVGLDFVKEVKKVAKKQKLRMHLDGARLLNALVEQEIEPHEYVKPFDTVSICLSKGLGCPVGSVLLGKEKDIYYARNIRKMLGGGMRQAGMTAVCALVAFDDWNVVLKEDNAKAKQLAHLLESENDFVACEAASVKTNMLTFQLLPSITKKKGSLDHQTLSRLLKEQHNILTLPSFFNDYVRVVTHRDVTVEDVETTHKAILEVIKANI